MISCSAFFSASETAFNCVNGIRLKNLAKEGDSAAQRAYRVYKNQTAAITTVLIGNNIVNILATALATSFFTALFPEYGVLLSTVAMTLIVLIFGEITPKVVAQNQPEKVCMKVARPMWILMKILKPFSFVVVNIKDNWEENNDVEKVTATEDELLEIVSTIEQEGVLEQEERELIESVIDFDDTTIKDVMVPFSDTVWIYDNDSYAKLKKVIKENKLSRFPVIDHENLKVVGIVNVRDVLEAMLIDKSITIKGIMSEPYFTSQHRKLPAVLEDIQKNRSHLMIVTENSKNNNFVGIVTLEDLLEELVGEIYDEYDPLPDHVLEIGLHTFEIDGKVNLVHFFEQYLEDERKPKTTARTIALWVYELAGKKKVRKGKEIEFENYEIKVLSTKDGLATKIELTVNTPKEIDDVDE